MPSVSIAEKLIIGEDQPLALIAGPCVLQERDFILRIAEELTSIAANLQMPFIFKASYDKANRTSVDSPRGPGLDDGLELLGDVKEAFGCPVLSDVHETAEAEAAGEVLDVLQIPAFLCRQTDLLVSAARTGRVVNVKKGQFLAPWDMKHVVDKVESAGSKSLMLTERGTSFGYNTLVSDMRSLPALREFGYPVVYDATHSVQMPGGLGGSSGGQREMVPHLLRAAVAVGCDAIFVETHPSPDEAPSDGPNMVPLEELENLLQGILQMDAARRSVDGI
ncbi:MAG: 3-deoxy-8-phosphooctulonate synthase [Planctomycetota bacterium]|nr:3-deoxy-8-phosphooctulonate synthase [Planctomycetota bacterium]MDP7130832.1 3-deoxy-8-phosphooctulonate synthase [Planctomycetota bacterium]MDP7253427.1 3-deoxy-8-phosphooctulonate synthase [Planctomycetota bacterium]